MKISPILISILLAELTHAGPTVDAGPSRDLVDGPYPKLYERLQLKPYCPVEWRTTLEDCTYAIQVRFSMNSFSIIPLKHAAIFMNTRMILDTNTTNRPFVVLKVQDLDVNGMKKRPPLALPFEGAEVRVGFLLNELMFYFCPTGLPRIEADFGPAGDVFELEDVSRYVGFVSTLDFGFCSASALSNSIGKSIEDTALFRRWYNDPYHPKRRGNTISELFIALEQLNDLSLEHTMLTPTWLFPRDPEVHWKNIELDDPADMNLIRPNYDPLRSVFIQILSTLWYATAVQFTHWDLHSGNIVSHRVPNMQPGDAFFFDIMPFDKGTRAQVLNKGATRDVKNEYTESRADKYTSQKKTTSLPKAARKPKNGKPARRYSSDFAEVAPRFYSHRETSPVFRDGVFYAGGNQVEVVNPKAPTMYQIHKSSGRSSALNLEKLDIGDDEADDGDDGSALDSIKRPLVRFKVPHEVTQGKVYKIIDFGRSRARGPKDDVTFGFYTDEFDPSLDLYHLCLDLVMDLDIPHMIKAFDSPEAKKHFPLAWRNEVEREYNEFREFMQMLTGWQWMQNSYKDKLYELMSHDLRCDVRQIKEGDWLLMMHKAFMVKAPETSSNPEGFGVAYRNFQQKWALNRGAKPEDAEGMKKFETDFKRNVIKLLRSKFLRKFRIDHEENDD